MSDTVIKVEGISKKFRIGSAEKAAYKTLRDNITEAFSYPFRKTSELFFRHKPSVAKDIWALKNVSFDVSSGEVIGIIGRNGAGKSTLLKILSRITEPTGGFAEIRGRVGSLLEVGTGFHPELTGRENIYLSGAILGMGRDEIKRNFDEIVSFAEVEKFVDTPVKRFSSGMYLRLAFSVAAHLNPEILIVDEVLAVGDTRFQEKCLNKMDDVGRKGRTVLFVSHSMPNITRLCKRAILLENGTVAANGASHSIVNLYLNNGRDTAASREWTDMSKAPGTDIVRLRGIRIILENGCVMDTVDISQTFGVEMEYEVLKPGYMLMPYYHFYNETNIAAFDVHDTDKAWRRRPRPAGLYKSTAWVHGNLLSEGRMFISAGLTRVDAAQTQFHEKYAVTVQIVENLENDSPARGDWSGEMGGVVRPLLRWSTQYGDTHDSPQS